MKNYEKIILNKLLDKYEKSKHARGEESNRGVFLEFNKRNIPDYFDGNDYKKVETINNSCKELERKDYIKIYWQKYREDEVVVKVGLNMSQVESIYAEIGRKQEKEIRMSVIENISSYLGYYEIIDKFVSDIVDKIRDGKSVKKFVDLHDKKDIKNIFDGLFALLHNTDAILKRNFSIRVYKNSKTFEKYETRIAKILKEYGDYTGLETTDEILAEHYIYKNPGYVYIKGVGEFKINDETIDLKKLGCSIGLSEEGLDRLEVIKTKFKSIYTVENLTTFNTFVKKDALIIYLGGFHNSIRREFIKKVSKDNNIKIYHFGDIDLGGFRILNHLRSKTGLEIIPYKMDIDTLEKYKTYTKKIDGAYKKKLKGMYGSEEYKEFREVLEHMIENEIILEQESIEW